MQKGRGGESAVLLLHEWSEKGFLVGIIHRLEKKEGSWSWEMHEGGEGKWQKEEREDLPRGKEGGRKKSH